jgi:hypothetical protein
MGDTMDDKYLDNIFQEKLEFPQHHDFEETAWLDLENRLEDEPVRRMAWWTWVAAAGILLPMLLSSIYFYHQLRKTEQQLTNMETKINRFLQSDVSKIITKQKEADVSLVENDESREAVITAKIPAVISNRVIAETPTYSTKSIETKRNSQSSDAETNGIIAMIRNNNSDQIIQSSNGTKQITETINQSKIYGSNATLLVDNNDVYTKAFPVSKTNTVNYGNWFTKERTLDIKESTWMHVQKQFIAVGFEVGIDGQGGILLSQAFSEKPFLQNKGIKGAINFMNGTDLTLGANYAAYTYEAKTIAQDFPHVEPENPTDLFQSITVSETVIQIPVGVKYNFEYADDVFSPFVEIGGIAKKSIQKNHKYDYLPNSLPSRPYSITPKPERISETFAMNTATAAIGIKWNPNLPKSPILDNMIVEAEIFGNADFETKDTQLMAGIGVSASYMF